MNPERFTRQAQEAMARTQAVATEFGHSTVEPEHLLVALLEQPQSPVADAVRTLEADPEKIGAAVRRVLGRVARQEGSQTLYLGRRGKRVIDAAMFAANQSQDKFVGAEHLFLAIMAEGGAAAEILVRAGINPQNAAAAFKGMRGDRTIDN